MAHPSLRCRLHCISSCSSDEKSSTYQMEEGVVGGRSGGRNAASSRGCTGDVMGTIHNGVRAEIKNAVPV